MPLRLYLINITPGRNAHFCCSRNSVTRVSLQLAHVAMVLTLSIGGVKAAPLGPSLADLSLEQLAEIKVISVTKSEKSIAAAAAAIYAITEQDIRRSTASSLPEALRLAPNLQVARIDARSYAISARGFNSRLANKLLVLIDGRSIYSPLFSGVFWDVHDVMLEDLDRIEVVSGPGGTLWGANAVNGVINIVSRSAAQTQGELVSIGVGANEHKAAVRSGGELANDGHYRLYAQHGRHDSVERADGSSSQSEWQRAQAGFRADWQSQGESFTLQGDAYNGNLQQQDERGIAVSGANLLARAERILSRYSTLSLQAYVDHRRRDQPSVFREHLNVVDIELQQQWSAGKRHRLVWGGGYRFMRDDIDSDERLAFVPERRNLRWHNVFFQDEVTLFDNVRLTLGSKFEYNPFSQWEVLPSAHLAWVTAPEMLIWTSLSRVVRSPSRLDRDLFSPANPEVIDGVPQYDIAGGSTFTSEKADIFEVGYRGLGWADASYSVAGFFNRYDDLRTLEANPNGPGEVFANGARAHSYGIEMWSSWQPTAPWRLHGGLVLQRIHFDLKDGRADSSSTTSLAVGDPKYYGQLRSSYHLADDVILATTVRHVAELEGSEVPAYTELNGSLSWMLNPRLKLSLEGRNLLAGKHSEFGDRAPLGEFGRTFYGKLVWGL